MKKGFTLFELLVSISIIGILTALGVVSFSSAQAKARDARRVEDMNIIQKAVEQVYSAGSSYPSSVGPWVGYLENWPSDPKSGTAYTYNISGGTYCVCAVLENTAKANAAAGCNYSGSPKTSYCVKSQQ